MIRRPHLVAVCALAALALAAPEAQAAACLEQPLARTFEPWLDPAWYHPAPDGGFESGGGWTLDGGAAVVDGNQPHLAGSRSLSLPAGSSATTAPICVSVAHPTIRFFARNSGAPLTPLNVSVIFGSLLGQVELPVGIVLAGQAWTPSPVVLVLANVLSSEVRFRFRPTTGGEWQIDDMFVDPYSKG